MTKKAKKRLFLSIFIPVLSFHILLVAGIVTFISLQTKPLVTVTSIEKYRDSKDTILNDKWSSRTELFIFPDSLLNKKVEDFKFMKKHDTFNQFYCLYLSIEYDEADYENEIDRISKIHKHFDTFKATKKILYFEDDNCYLTVQKHGMYEFALCDENELKIEYIYNQYFDWKTIDIGIEYINYQIPDAVYDEGYNLYSFSSVDMEKYSKDE